MMTDFLRASFANASSGETEIICKKMRWNTLHPVRHRSFLISPTVEHAYDFAFLLADILHRVTAPTWQVSTISSRKFGHGQSLVRKQRA